jgi:hypothetical protein
MVQDWINIRLRKRSSGSSLIFEAQGFGCRPARFVRENRTIERGGAGVPSWEKRGAYAALLLAMASLSTLAGCAAERYMGVPLAAGAAEPELQALARRAHAGDKNAQLELGIRYEEGRGVPSNPERAERLYRMAASQSGGATYVYSPPVGTRPGQVVEASRETARAGLVEAERRLAQLLDRRAQNDPAGPTPGPSEPDGEPATPNAVALELWRSVASLASLTNEESVREALRNSMAALEGSTWRFRRSTLTCPENPSGTDFPLSRAACGTAVQQFERYHFWDEELSPGGRAQLTEWRAGCLTSGEAMNMLLRDWRPESYSFSPRVVAVPRPSGSRPTYIVRGGSHDAGEVVFRSQSGLFIYVYSYASTSCISNFHLLVT